jgi:hypothetical protein
MVIKVVLRRVLVSSRDCDEEIAEIAEMQFSPQSSFTGRRGRDASAIYLSIADDSTMSNLDGEVALLR